MLKHINLKNGELHILEDVRYALPYSAFEALIKTEMGDEAAEYFRFIIEQKDFEILEANDTNEHDSICVNGFHRIETLTRKLPEDLTYENLVENLAKINAIKDAVKSYRGALDAI